jgi:hypothetical protein
MIDNLFVSPLKVVNIGLESFHESILVQNVFSVHLDWKPVAGGDLRIARILELLNQ